MKIYVVERNNPKCWEEPQIYTDGNKAIADIRKEYEGQMKKLGTSHEIADSGDGSYGCDWMINEEHFCGECQITEDWEKIVGSGELQNMRFRKWVLL